MVRRAVVREVGVRVSRVECTDEGEKNITRAANSRSFVLSEVHMRSFVVASGKKKEIR